MKLSSDIEAIYRLQEYGKAGGIEGVSAVPLRRFNDAGGTMIELLRLGQQTLPAGLEDFRPVQINYSTLQPGVIKAFHVHRRQTDVWFVPPEDRLLLVLVDVRRGSVSENRRLTLMLGDGRSELVRIPPGVAHGCRNLGQGPARVVYMVDLLFDTVPENCDEGRLPWDFVGPEIWEIPRE